MSTGQTGKIKSSFLFLKVFWNDHDQKILTFLAIVLAALVGFQAGVTRQKEKEVASIQVNLSQNVANNPEEIKLKAIADAMDRKGVDIAKLSQNLNSLDFSSGQTEGISQTVVAGQATENQDSNKCAFVGSKNSNKYHLPSCRYAANIKPENKVCFSSKEDAEAKGYVPAGCCIK